MRTGRGISFGLAAVVALTGMLATAPAASAGVWQITRIERGDPTPARVAGVAIDSHGAHHVLVQHGTYRYWTDRSGSWVSTDLYAMGVGIVHGFAIDPSDVVHVLWTDRNGSPSGLLHATLVDGVLGAVDRLDYTPNFSAAMAIDQAGVVHVIATTTFGSNAEYTSNAGGAWAPLAPLPHDASSVNPMPRPDIAVDSSGTVHVVFEYVKTDACALGCVDGKYHDWLPAGSDTWQTEKLPDEAACGWGDLVVDGADHLHIVCGSDVTIDGLVHNVMLHTTNASGSWQSDTIAMDAASGVAGMIGGTLTVAMMLSPVHGMSWATWNGSSWSTAPISDESILPEAMTADSAGGPYIGGRAFFVGTDGSEQADAVVVSYDGSGPVGAPPSPRLTASSTLTSTGAIVRMVWSAVDPAGILQYQLQQRTGTGAWVTVALPTKTATSLSKTLTFGHTYAFRMRAEDRLANWSAWTAAPITFSFASYQEATSLAKYAGSWSSGTTSSAWGGHYKATTRAGAAVTFAFTGRSVAVVSRRSTTSGSVKVYLDGVYKGAVSLRAATTWRWIAYVGSWSTVGKHVLKLVAVGTAGHPTVTIDGFLILR